MLAHHRKRTFYYLSLVPRLQVGRYWVRLPVGAKDFSLQNVEASSGAPQASCSVDTWALSRVQSGRNVKIATHRNLVPVLGMSKAKFDLYMYVCSH